MWTPDNYCSAVSFAECVFYTVDDFNKLKWKLGILKK